MLHRGALVKTRNPSLYLARCYLLAALLSFVTFSTAAPLTNEGARVAEVIDALHVEAHWPAGQHINWETGIPDGRPVTTQGKHTHCSAFVASAAEHLGVYILRPPEHGQTLLANAQWDWLDSAAAAVQGWHPVRDGVEAQEKANQGELVVVVYKNHNPEKPGHIAIVRPSDKSETALLNEGPQITQAGGTNYRSATLREGFKSHPGAWSNGEIRFFAHAVSLH